MGNPLDQKIIGVKKKLIEAQWQMASFLDADGKLQGHPAIQVSWRKTILAASLIND
jgi:hypothetical protein